MKLHVKFCSLFILCSGVHVALTQTNFCWITRRTFGWAGLPSALWNLNTCRSLSAAVSYNRTGFSCYLHTELWRGRHLDVCRKENCVMFTMTAWWPPKYSPSHMPELCSGVSKDSRGKVTRSLCLDKWKTCECPRLLKTGQSWDVTMSSVVEIHWHSIESYCLVLEDVKVQRLNQFLFRPITGL